MVAIRKNTYHFLLWLVYIVAHIGIDCGLHFWEHKGNNCGFQIKKLSTTKATITYNHPVQCSKQIIDWR